MITTNSTKIASKVEVAFKYLKKKAIAERLGISRPTLDTRLKDNNWRFSEIEELKKLGIL